MALIRLDNKDGNARTGRLYLPHGEVETPAFMPVGTNATVKGVYHDSLTEIGYNLILANTYHLYLRPGIEVISKHCGLHNFASWSGNILTDSGGYQIFSLSEFRNISPEGVVFKSHLDGSAHKLTAMSVVDFQVSLGSDIQMQLDFCTPPEIPEDKAREALAITTNWAKSAKERWLTKQAEYSGSLFGIVQGNFFKKLRKQSAEQLTELDLPGYAIGGLSVGEAPEIFKEMLHFTSPLLPEYKPKYVMGIGTPDYMFEAIEAGIDMFDCVYPTRVARNGSAYTPYGMINLRNAQFREDESSIDATCNCPACRKYSRSYLRHLFMAKEMFGPMLLSCHNLQFLYTMMENARQAVRNKQFQKFKKQFLENFEGH